MNNFTTRVVFVGLAIPVLFALAVLIPEYNHAPIAVIALFFTIGSALELRVLLEPEAGVGRSITAATLAALPYVAVYVVKLVLPSAGVMTTWLGPTAVVIIAGFLASSIPLAFPRAVDTVSLTILKVTRNALYMLYPGALSSAIVIILAAREFSGSLLIWFALIVFGNDSFAWLAGVTLGRKRGIFTVSPNKSLEGLIAGMAGSIGFAMAGPILFPEAIPPRWLALAILGVAVGIAVVSGDLFESALKRSAGVKDSGSIIPGRGGVLDSYDSLLFAAPVFCGITVMMGLLS